jgi:hypothetical protein
MSFPVIPGQEASPRQPPDGRVPKRLPAPPLANRPSTAGSDADQVAELRVELEQLRAAMASRATIEQAKGILMLLTTCGDQVAFDLLTHISSHTHRKVRDVAQAITESAAGHARLPADVRSILRDACPPGEPLR